MQNPAPAARVDLASQPVQIAPNTWWVGKRPPGQIFYANPYLRTFPARGGADPKPGFNMLIDPGSNNDFAVVRAKTERVIGSLEKVGGIFINHQDPDVGSAVGLMMGRYTPRAHVLCSEDTWRLVQYYNIPRNRFVQLERFPNGMYFPNGEEILPVPSPFCHFVGAVMLYDPQTKVLFSGDLFGSLTDREASGLYADESDWAGMRAFHQIYMPSNQALRHAVRMIREKCPDLKVIAPQHGRVIHGAWVQEFIRRIEELPVGLDILGDRHASEDELRAWSSVLNRVVAMAEPYMPNAQEVLATDADLRDHLEHTPEGLRVTNLGRVAIERAVRLLCARIPSEAADPVRYEAVTAAGELDLPTPNIELDEGDAPAGEQGRPKSDTGQFAFARIGE